MFSGRGLCVSLGTVCILVKVLHESEEGELVKEDLRDLNQQILTTVLQRAAHELTQGLLRACAHTHTFMGSRHSNTLPSVHT